jgi:hypothetical protein
MAEIDAEIWTLIFYVEKSAENWTLLFLLAKKVRKVGLCHFY